MQIRRDLEFLIITKRVNRFFVSLPEDWEEGYENVTVCCTCLLYTSPSPRDRG